MHRVAIGWLGMMLAGLVNAAEVTQGATSPPRFEVASTDQVAHGERLSHVLGCVGCHTRELTGEDWSDPEMGVLWTANLTQSAKRYSAEALTAMIVEGRRPDRPLMDMPSVLFTEVHPDDIAALVTYLRSLAPIGAVHPEPTIGPKLARDIASGSFLDSAQTVAAKVGAGPPDLGEAHRLGRHIARATCMECHGADLRGSSEPMADAPRRPDLRMTIGYSAENFERFMRTGKALGDRELQLMSAVARYRYSRFTDAEIDALYAYLVALAKADRQAANAH